VGNIRSLQSFDAGRWDWAFLRGHIPRGLGCMDIDGVSEINGFFLVLEGKRPNGQMQTPQRICLERMSAIPGFTVLLVVGQPGDPPTINEIWRGVNRRWREVDAPSLEALQDIVAKWGRAADNNWSTAVYTPPQWMLKGRDK